MDERITSPVGPVANCGDPPNHADLAPQAALPPEAPPSSLKGERGAGGRFAAGNRGGPGNPFARRVAEFRKALLEAVRVEDIQRIIGSLVAQAVLGDVPAARLVLSYVLGKPGPV